LTLVKKAENRLLTRGVQARLYVCNGWPSLDRDGVPHGPAGHQTQWRPEFLFLQHWTARVSKRMLSEPGQ